MSGCGGSGPAPATVAAHAQFVTQADAICRQIATKRTATNSAVASAGSSPNKQLRVIARLGPAVVAEEQNAMNRLRALKAPSSLAHAWGQLLTGMQTLTDDAAHIAIDAKRGDVKAVEALTSSGRKVRQHLTPTAALQGFRYCGRES
jgi:flagellar biosynthesis/type III secretory pathway M-ring protein FliF/YscJ